MRLRLAQQLAAIDLNDSLPGYHCNISGVIGGIRPDSAETSARARSRALSSFQEVDPWQQFRAWSAGGSTGNGAHHDDATANSDYTPPVTNNQVPLSAHIIAHISRRAIAARSNRAEGSGEHFMVQHDLDRAALAALAEHPDFPHLRKHRSHTNDEAESPGNRDSPRRRLGAAASAIRKPTMPLVVALALEATAPVIRYLEQLPEVRAVVPNVEVQVTDRVYDRRLRGAEGAMQPGTGRDHGR